MYEGEYGGGDGVYIFDATGIDWGYIDPIAGYIGGYEFVGGGT